MLGMGAHRIFSRDGQGLRNIEREARAYISGDQGMSPGQGIRGPGAEAESFEAFVGLRLKGGILVTHLKPRHICLNNL